ncbi:MAG: tRNA 5-methoxyuridine(34)/uridine 5-oxyacetic acid(34) synthase CmoB, partial [Granulosicoccus sp.]|nr:tRNA 5-methoxyuridine(34)/uridine 5-oxyacetic acid(34) synthase CmoB [Granulosicoccus sp.]
LPDLHSSQTSLITDAVTANREQSLSDQQIQQLTQSLQALHPWRKGPFHLFGVSVDAEWRSQMKWNRLIAHVKPLKDRVVLDVGCGNGYYLFRMVGEGAKMALGIDPTQLFLAQFAAINRYVNCEAAAVLPLKSEDMPSAERVAGVEGFDTVFSMGIYYHRRCPQQHLLELKGFLRTGGELVLETLIIPGAKSSVLEPVNRYAQMRNVWMVPSASVVIDQLETAGFKNVRLVDQTLTTSEEQRTTEWMRFESLDRFLHPENPEYTVEGYPAPLRGVFIAEREN